jgi:hypothetical protein
MQIRNSTFFEHRSRLAVDRERLHGSRPGPSIAPHTRSAPCFGAKPMRSLASMLAIVYLVGIGLAIVPTVQSNWHNSTPVLYTNVVRALPEAFAWPVTAIRALVAR